MLKAYDFRKMARESLAGKWGWAILTGFVGSILGASIMGGSSSITSLLDNDTTRENFEKFINLDFFNVLFVFLLGMGSVFVLLGIVRFIIGGAVTLGYAKFNTNLIYGRQIELADLFSEFRRLLDGFLMQLLRWIFIFLWSLLLIIPGIVAMYSYSMTPYVMNDHPELNSLDAITYSKNLMRGHRWRLFCLHVSFIGWGILCAFSFGIGYLWLIPYAEAANAAFYREISQ